MHDDHDPRDPDELAKLGYETRDIAIRPLVRVLVGLGVFLVGAQIVAYVVFRMFANTGDAGALRVRVLPPLPRLQVTPKRDLRELRTAENARLNSYGVDRATGESHIPIARAMDLIAKEGLPAPQSPSVSPAQAGPKPLPRAAPGVAPVIGEHRP